MPVAEGLLTEAGRRPAAERCDRMERFLAEFFYGASAPV